MAIDLNLKVVAQGLGFPEGPVAMADGSLLFVEIKKQQLSRLGADGTVSQVADLAGGPNGVAIGPDKAAYVCNNGGIYSFVSNRLGSATLSFPGPVPNPGHQPGSIQRVDLETGRVTTLYTSCDGKPLLTPDDIVFDAEGGFWFTDSGIEYPDRLERGGVYYATIDGRSIRKVTDHLSIPTPNGVGLSADGKTLYVSDTAFGRLWALDVPSAGVIRTDPLHQLLGMPGNAPLTLPSFQVPAPLAAAFGVPPGQTAYQWVDSLKVDSAGCVCIGTLLNGGITVFDPGSGSVEHVPVPDLFTTNLCFGGADLQDVWITASSTGMIYKGRWPRPGLKPAFCA